LTALKRNWFRKEAPKSKDTPDLFSELKKEITPIRKQGESPTKDPGSFARYMCDLCSTPHAVSELRQCVLCGRWGCENCWKEEFYTCKSCAGIIKIHSIRSKE
jgi:hypothetical protein